MVIGIFPISMISAVGQNSIPHRYRTSSTQSYVNGKEEVVELVRRKGLHGNLNLLEMSTR